MGQGIETLITENNLFIKYSHKSITKVQTTQFKKVKRLEQEFDKTEFANGFKI